jgi:nitrate reductase gamma subunit
VKTTLWVVIPYLALASFVIGHVWRYRYDAFGWTTRSTQMLESRLLSLASPMFHFGILLVAGGHVVGLLVPMSVTEKLGISEHVYHRASLVMGSVAGTITVVGLAILVYRRRTTKAVFRATTRNDKAMYVLLGAVLAVGMATTVLTNALGHPHEYRETVSPYLRSVLALQPDVDKITAAPWGFQLHTFLAWVLIGVWPYTRLVHVFSAPLGYLTRPYVVYRSRESSPTGAREPRRGWEPVRLPEQTRR